jgi:hypothetical protein
MSVALNCGESCLNPKAYTRERERERAKTKKSLNFMSEFYPFFAPAGSEGLLSHEYLRRVLHKYSLDNGTKANFSNHTNSKLKIIRQLASK